jgi:hypothetical protein
LDETEIQTIISAIIAMIGGYFALSATQESNLIAGIMVVAGAILSWVQTKNVSVTASTATAQVQALTPGTPQASNPAIVSTLPPRSYLMSDATKQWITFDATPENKATILAQVASAEAQHLTQYQITFDGGYYLIQYGLQYGGAGNPSGIKTN